MPLLEPVLPTPVPVPAPAPAPVLPPEPPMTVPVPMLALEPRLALVDTGPEAEEACSSEPEQKARSRMAVIAELIFILGDGQCGIL